MLRYVYIIVLYGLFIQFGSSVVQLPKGFHFDIEPHTLTIPWRDYRNEIANQYLDLLEKIKLELDGTGYLFTVDVGFFYDTTNITRNNVQRPLAYWVLLLILL